ncbi:hypothetical protein EBR44_04965 [bacterium]|nr:hypothetical protein [bacterium]
MAARVFQLVLHYDGTGFSGWQVQPDRRTVQGELEGTLTRLCGEPVRVAGAGRTDAGVHARGQAASVHVAEHWTVRAALGQSVRGRARSGRARLVCGTNAGMASVSRIRRARYCAANR